MSSILVTGGNGFIGRALLKGLKEQHINAIGSVRRLPTINEDDSIELRVVSDLDHNTQWEHLLKGCDVVVHTAARAHVMEDSSADPLAEYRRVNVEGTLNLARQAIVEGIKRFVFISSIKVNGERTVSGKPFTEDVCKTPEDPYAASKYEAEQGLLELAESTGMEVVIIRPPLVYGADVKGNFASMIRLLKRGYPLPLGLVNNKRSLVGLSNLIDFIITCTKHKAAANQVFLVSDGNDMSTTDLLTSLSRAMDLPSRLMPIPEKVLMLAAILIGKRAIADRLFGSLQVDITKARSLLGWEPPVSVEEGLKSCKKIEEEL